MEKCSQRILITCEEPKRAVPILDQMHIKQYQILDKTHIAIRERLDESGRINQALVKQDIMGHEIMVTGEELESYFLRMTGGNEIV